MSYGLRSECGSDLRSNEHFLSSSKNKAWKKNSEPSCSEGE